MLKNARTWKRILRKVSGAGLRSIESPDGEGEFTRDRQFTISQRKLVPRSAAGTRCTWKKVTVVVDFRECDADDHVSRDRDQANREVQEWKRIQGTRGENIKNYGQRIHVR